MRLATVVCVAFVALVAGPAAATAAPPAVGVAAQPARPLFGDTFDYVVTVETDRDQSEAVRIETDVAPLTPMGPARLSRSADGGRARVTQTQAVACLAAGCLQGPGGTAATLAAPRITVAGAAVPAPALSVHVGTRVAASAVRSSKPGFSRPHDLPALSTRVSVDAAAIALSMGGAALVIAGILGIVVPIRRRAARVVVPGADSVARAVRLLRESEVRGARDRRRAASLVARVVGEDELAGEAARVAWSRHAPGPPEAAALANQVEDATGARG